ncbi:MAG: DUF1257 domain-containing protein [Pseudomonadota bacterium]|nr:DUF1257 domain-containing protein [Pseudomonadota bacterium]
MCDLNLLGIQADPETVALVNKLCSCGCHVSTLKLEVKSLESLKAACARLGLIFQEGQTHYKWYGHYMDDSKLPEGFSADDLGKCTHAIQVPGAKYEIGVQRWADGTFKLLYDSWSSGGLTEALGTDLNKLRQAYGIEAALEAAQRQGYSAWEEILEDGAVKLHVQVPA